MSNEAMLMFCKTIVYIAKAHFVHNKAAGQVIEDALKWLDAQTVRH